MAILFSLSLFSVFVKRPSFSNRTINNIAACTFGVYLTSENVFVRKFLWVDVFKNADFFGSAWLPLQMFGAVAVVYAVCSLIEAVRKNLFHYFEQKYLDAYWDAQQEKFENWLKRLKL